MLKISNKYILFFSVFLFILLGANQSSGQAATPSRGLEAFLAGARAEVKRAPFYTSDYYRGGYPPETIGVCTDLIWRAFRDAGINLKQLIDDDIKANPGAYPRVTDKADLNIDFRRVPNQSAYLKRYSQIISNRFSPNDRSVMDKWKPGDIVVFKNPDHIAVISDKKNNKGVPFLLHNDGPWAKEADDFESWAKKGIAAHYRWNFAD